jgi:hypothetical protein
MNQSGDAAEQVVRFSLEGMEYAIKIVGSGAKQIAAFLLAALKSDGSEKKPQTKLRGKERLTNMLKSGQPLKIFGVKNSDLEVFAKEAKRYGVVYCALRDKNAKANDLIDIMVKVEDSPKLDRILEKLEFMTVDRASVENDLVKGNEKQAPELTDTESIIDLMIDDEGKPIPDSPENVKAKEAATAKQEVQQNPPKARIDRGVPSEPTLDTQSRTERADRNEKPSVKEFLDDSTARKRKERDEKSIAPPVGEKSKEPQKSNTHIQPQNKRRKSKPKERN